MNIQNSILLGYKLVHVTKILQIWMYIVYNVYFLLLFLLIGAHVIESFLFCI